MLKPARLFKLSLIFLGILSAALPLAAGESAQFKKNETGLYRDVFDQNIYYEWTSYLRFDRLYRKLFNRKARAGNVNVYDEVPDSSFFTNRHARSRLSTRELKEGHKETDGLETGSPITLKKGKFEGIHPGFFVEDSNGDDYLLKFDPIEFLELSTSAEVVASRFYHAIGYNVPQYTVATFSPEKLVLAADATVYDTSGFKKKFTKERLEEYLVLLPVTPEGALRASASKILAGENKGFFSFMGRRKNDPADPIPHKDRREIRALQVFSSWLANYDIRESNTLDMLVNENGKSVLKHYLIDFNCALGAGTSEGKPPMTTYEYLVDYGDSAKALFALGLWEKPWQKRWREAGEEIKGSSAAGYFSGNDFKPGKFKIQLPHYVFKDLTRADGFWAAKIINTFSDEDIHAMVKAGDYTNSEDADTIAKVLIERRDVLVRYWFGQANPLDDFDVRSGVLTFRDLAVEKGLTGAEGTRYQAEAVTQKDHGAKKIASTESREPSIDLSRWLSQHGAVDLFIRTLRPGESKPSPYVLVGVNSKGVTGVSHQD